jgi:hypothetical protein
MLQFSAMIRAEQKKFALILAPHLLWGLVLAYSISKYGLGASTDSVQMLFGGQNLAAGAGLISYDGSFLYLWPPLYPVLLGLVHAVTGLRMLASATFVQAAAFLCTALSLTTLIKRIFAEDLVLALGASVLSEMGMVMLVGFGMTGSDYLGLALALVFLAVLATYLEHGNPKTYVWLAIIGMLAVLNRYLGLAVIASGAISIWLLGSGGARQRLLRAGWLVLGAVPGVVWLAITSQLTSRRPPISLAENWGWFSRSIVEWFAGLQASRRELDQHTLLLWGGVLFLVLVAGALGHRSPQEPEAAPARFHLIPLFVFGLAYSVTLFGAASLAYFNKLSGRFILPLYIPLIILPVVDVKLILNGVKRLASAAGRSVVRAVGYLLLLGLAVSLLRITWPVARLSHANGVVGGENAFNTRAWNENEALRYWQSNRPQGPYVLFSNQADGVAFQTGHAVEPAPRKTSGPYGTETYALGSYGNELFGSGKEAYLLWIDPNPYPYFYSVDELGSTLRVTRLFESADGGVYTLQQR